MGGIILACLTALYALLFLFFIVGLLKTHRYKGPKATPSVSVVIPMRNEEEFAERTLEAVAAQDYVGEWEVICVDDRSTDRTREILEKFAATHPRFRVLSLPQDLPQIASPKKRALESAFKIAKNEVLLTMDADCIPRKSWITAMAGRFVDGICIVSTRNSKRSATPRWKRQVLALDARLSPVRHALRIRKTCSLKSADSETSSTFRAATTICSSTR